MSHSFAGFGLLALAAVVGCGGTSHPGMTDEPPIVGLADDAYHLRVPVMSSALQQGRIADAIVGIQRGKSFDEEVALKFTELPRGVTIDPASPVIKRGETLAKVVFHATGDAPLGPYQVKVLGHPTKGLDAKAEMKLTVATQDTFRLSLPTVMSVKHGTSKTVSIAIARDATFDQDVALRFEGMPRGVTIEPKAVVIKQGVSEVQITLAASREAALGDFTIHITGQPTTGLVAATQFQLNLAKE